MDRIPDSTSPAPDGEMDDAAIDKLLTTLFDQGGTEPATRSIDLGAALSETSAGEAASRLDLSQLLDQPDLKENLTHLIMEKFKLPEAMAVLLAGAIMKNVSKRKTTRRKTSKPRKTSSSATAKKKTNKSTAKKKTASSTAKKKTSSTAAKRKTSSSTTKKKTSKSTAKKKTSQSTAKKKTSQRTRSGETEEIKPE